jgi:DNA gyrase/topoisomerase IV subunit B
MEGNVKEFIRDAFDYPTQLVEASLDRSANRYLLEHIAHGIVQYDGVDGFIENIDKWLRSLANIYKEIGFDHSTHQITATIDLEDQVIVVDEALANLLEYVINVQKKYGMLITYKTADGECTTTLLRFFENVQKFYPQIADRFKGLGSSESYASREVITDPKTRRISRVVVSDVYRTIEQMGILVGKGKEDVKRRKEMLMDFKFTTADIDT